MKLGSNLKVFIFHGLGGSPKSSWKPWLKNELENKGFEVIIPKFPNSKSFYVKAILKDIFPKIKTQTFNNWFKEIDLKKFDENSVLVGHSLGAVFVLKLLEKIDKPVKAVFLIAPSIGVKKQRFYNAVYDFTNGLEFDWAKIKKGARRFEVFHSQSDKTVPFKNGKVLADRLGIELISIPNAGHFTTRSGYKKFPKLLQEVLK